MNYDDVQIELTKKMFELIGNVFGNLENLNSIQQNHNEYKELDIEITSKQKQNNGFSLEIFPVKELNVQKCCYEEVDYLNGTTYIVSFFFDLNKDICVGFAENFAKYFVESFSKVLEIQYSIKFEYSYRIKGKKLIII